MRRGWLEREAGDFREKLPAGGIRRVQVPGEHSVRRFAPRRGWLISLRSLRGVDREQAVHAEPVTAGLF